jgi:hypothetical protein
MTSSLTGCTVINNVITLTNALSSPFTKGSGTSLSFVFSGGGTNPNTVSDAGTFTVSTYAVISGSPYAIDSSSFTNIFTPTPGILNATVTPASLVAYNSPTTYIISITPIKIVPQNGFVLITFPTEISGSSNPTCTSSLGSVSCSATTSPYTVNVTGGFASSSYTAVSTPFTISITGLTNPRTTAVTSSFSIYTYGPTTTGVVAYQTTSITTQMTSTPAMTTFTVAPASGVNDA